MTTLSPAAAFAGPLDARDGDLVAALRQVLDTHGFATAAVPTALGSAIRSDFHLRVDLPLYLRRLSDPSPINTLVKLFVLDQWINDADARRALAPLDPADVAALGLIESDANGRVRARVRLSGYRDLVLAHDRYDDQTRTLQAHHVLDVNPTTVTLANLTVRRRVRTALDVGTGCGVLALLAARHADHVIGTDTNERALNMAAFNARLNGIEHVEWRLGSLFEPVAGSRFELIVCNPPYVISPETQYEFRDAGRRGDAICREVAALLPRHLEDGGFASMLCNWALARDEEFSAPPRRWVDGSGCDAWAVCSTIHDPLTYAALWNRTRDREAYDRAIDRWVAYCDELGIASIGFGAIILRRRDRELTWFRADRLPDTAVDECGAQIQRIFAAEDFLASVQRDGSLLAHRFVAAPDHRVMQTLVPSAGAYAAASMEIELTAGFRTRGGLDAYTLQLLTQCDGRRTLGRIVYDMTPDGGDTRDRLAVASAAIVRRLVATGFLVPYHGEEDTP